MRVALSFLTTAVALLLAASPARAQSPMTGGYASTPLTPELETLLFSALGNETTYDVHVEARVCVTKATAVEQQVVAGMNYRFTTTACDITKQSPVQTTQGKQSVGQCGDDYGKNCEGVTTVVRVYQSLSGSASVSEITVSEETKKHAGVHAAAMV